MDKIRMSPAKGELKQWAREKYKGVENLTMPSYKANLRELDEEGIRHDVRLSMRHGFFSTACVATLTDLEQYKRMLEVVCEEADGKMLVGAFIGEATREKNLELLAHATKVGCTHAIVVPRYIKPQSEGEIYAWYREIVDASKIPVVLYAQNNPNFRHLHPSGISLETFERLADIPSVVCVKFSLAINLVRALELADRLADKLLVGPVHLDMIPLLSRYCHIQWSGHWNAECAQSPQKPYVVEMIDALNCGKLDEAFKLYWTLQPAYHAYAQHLVPILLNAMHPWLHHKYNQWCVGGNGGLLPDFRKPGKDAPVLTAQDRTGIRQVFERIGITPAAKPEEDFMVGSAAYAQGRRRKDLAATPLYE